MSTNRLTALVTALGWSRNQTATQIGCHPSHASRMLMGTQAETRTQTLLLDRIARENGLDHLTAEAFAASAASAPAVLPAAGAILSAEG